MLLPPGRDTSLLQGYPKQYVASAHLKQWTKVPCLRKQCDRRGLNPGPPDWLSHTHASTDKLKQTKERLVKKIYSLLHVGFPYGSLIFLSLSLLTQKELTKFFFMLPLLEGSYISGE